MSQDKFCRRETEVKLLCLHVCRGGNSRIDIVALTGISAASACHPQTHAHFEVLTDVSHISLEYFSHSLSQLYLNKTATLACISSHHLLPISIATAKDIRTLKL